MVIGMMIAPIPSTLVPAQAGIIDLSYWLTVLAGGLISAFALSMDFPKSNVGFSRLSG